MVTFTNLPEITIGKTDIILTASHHTFCSCEILNYFFKFSKPIESVLGHGLTFPISLCGCWLWTQWQISRWLEKSAFHSHKQSFVFLGKKETKAAAAPSHASPDHSVELFPVIRGPSRLQKGRCRTDVSLSQGQSSACMYSSVHEKCSVWILTDNMPWQQH